MDESEKRVTVRMIVLTDSTDVMVVCGKCFSMIYPDEIICPVCGAENSPDNPVEMTLAECFPHNDDK